MSQARSAWIARRGGLPAVLCTVLLSSLAARNAAPQTQQPFLLATTQVNGNPAVASFTRNGAGGTLTEVAGSPFTLVTPGCYPSAIGGGSSPGSAPPPPPQIVTPSGMYTIIVTPSATASGSNKAFPLAPLNLTLIVK